MSTKRPAGKSPMRHTKGKGYASDGVKDNDIFKLPNADWLLLGALTVAAAAVRLYKISQPDSVVFDEVHFGGFASKYIHGRFFMDVHPPLAKMLIALFGWLAGYNGEFDFKDIGKDYTEPGVPYVAMRLFPGICGVITIPCMFLTLKSLGSRTTSAALGAALLIFENGLLTNNRLILLDSPLITATAVTGLCWVCFCNQHEQGPQKAFTFYWWFWLAMTGLFLGATASIKWVGLFTIAWVGSITLVQMWVLLGDPVYVTPRLWFKHFFARAFCLIVIPATFYLAMFAIHFVCLVNSGEGDGFMSSEFQATLNSKGMKDVPADVVLGSRVTIRHLNTQGGYLHSHGHMYPEGSKQQQVTLYPHKDENNVWIMENQTQPVNANEEEIKGPYAFDTLHPIFVEDGAFVKLYHVVTHRRVHSHDQRAPVTEAEWQQEVSAYGYEGFEGDANDLFKVEIVKSHSDGELAKQRLRTIETKFKLVHVMTGCTLFSHRVKLPDWGFEQQEVTCAKQGSLPNSIWYVETNDHPGLGESAEKVNYRNPGFLGKFWELQRVMWETNAGLVESHAWDSRPPSWPVLRRGINFWGKDNRQIYLMGNPLIWLSSTVAVAMYVAIKGLATLRWQRGFQDYQNITFKRFDLEVGMMTLAWAFHYFPFFLMKRQLFLHHYFPALYFAILVFAQVFDFIYYRTSVAGLRERPIIGQAAAVIFVLLSMIVFAYYAPLAYGGEWTKSECQKVKLLDTWDWDCNNFYDTYAEYKLNAVDRKNATDIPVVESPLSDVSQSQGMGFEVTPQAQQVEVVEYKDENGNPLDEAKYSELLRKGVKFETKHETRTHQVEHDANAGQQGVGGAKEGGIHPPHPDVDGRNPNTAGYEKGQKQAEKEANVDVPRASANVAPSNEQQIMKDERKAQPASERAEATKKSNVAKS